VKQLDRYADASVLVIDDNSSNTALLQAVLARAGLRNVHAYTDPRQAVEQLDQTLPDLVLVDLHMPYLDGYAVLAHVLTHANGAYLPALMLTADTTKAAIERALLSGARDFVTKPFDAIEVTLRVRNLLETRDLYKQLRLHNQRLRAQVEQLETEDLGVRRDRIRSTIEQQQMNVVFQPIIELSTGAAVGVEALARFPGEPRRGPDAWFAEAAQVGLGVALETLAVDAALEFLPALPPHVFLAVNLSPATLLSEDLLRNRPDDVWPRVVLELTEHDPIEDYDALAGVTARLRSLGARVAADDAGAGYAGFRHLLGLRPDIVKADLTLTRALDTDPARRALTSALVQFTHDTGARLIAEGIETAAEFAALRHLRVELGQGYHLARPRPLHETLSFCKGRPRGGSGR
jgi:EAL domain-containing protein (putative c-di-GMP-specific phosphodiesterase class I)/AmiR/NasT family two-component response regulator